MLRGIPLAALLALPALAVERIEPVPLLAPPLSPTPVVRQLQLDLAVLNVPAQLPALAPSALAFTPDAWANLKDLVPGAAAPGEEAAPTPTDALKRVEIARQILSSYDPGEFAKLPDAKKDEVLGQLWEGWKTRGLVSERSAAVDPRALDAEILAGVDDRALTAANKSIFLGAAVLGYPLQDSLWLARTRIGDALEENNLRYPEGQRWKTSDGTPEFLGTTPRAQQLLDDWGAAAENGREIVAQIKAGSTVLPKNGVVSPSAAAAFARLASELKARKDDEALDYLSGQDPTFSAFLLDVRKPGYYLYNGKGSVVDRIMASAAALNMGIRRVDHPDNHGAVVGSVYYYRPARVLARLREIEREPASADAEKTRGLLSAYAPRLAAVTPAETAPKDSSPFTFAAPEQLSVSVLQTPLNRLDHYAKTSDPSRYDLPLPIGSLRDRLTSGERHSSFNAERWDALRLLFEASPALRVADARTRLRLVSQSWQTSGKLVVVSQGSEPEVFVQVAALDELERLKKSPAKREEFLKFLSAAFEAALAPKTS